MASSKKTKKRSSKKHFNSAKLIERKLGREGALGQQHSDGKIEVDPRQTERERLDTICHELIHHVTPEWEKEGEEIMEEKTREAADIFTGILWKDGWRRIRT